MLDFDNTVLKEFQTEKKDRLENTISYSFGIKFLDDAVDGFYNNDVIIIGSKTGEGKTAICNMIAEHNARNGRKVLYLALEAEEKEVGRRMKFRNLCRRFFSENPEHYPLSYNKWRKGKIEDKMDYFEPDVINDVSAWGDNLIVRYREGDFTREDIRTNFISYAKDVDLIILDHLHYVDFEEENENKALKTTLKTIRDLNLQYKKPIIVVTHLRKTDKKFEGLVPEKEDVHGSSDIVKISTVIVLLAPSYEQVEGKEHLFKTYFSIPKSRGQSNAMPYVAELYFNIKTGEYDEKYSLGKRGTKVFTTPSYYPDWYSYRDKFKEEQNARPQKMFAR